MRAAQRDRDDVAVRREAFLAEVTDIPAERLVFVDESGVCRGMRTAYGYAPQGERCVETAPFRLGGRVNLLGWMSSRCGTVVGVEGSVTAAVFDAFVASHLVPSLEPGDVVVWDNARIHSPSAVALVESVGAHVLAQPPYSPDLNAIEMLWSKVKAILKRLAADTWEALYEALPVAVEAVTPSDAEGWITHCGYRFQPT